MSLKIIIINNYRAVITENTKFLVLAINNFNLVP